MARAFTSTFTYKNQHYMAVITQVDGSVSIYVPDESLHGILPQGKFTYNPEQGLKIDTTRLSPVQDLVLTILRAVELQHQHNEQEHQRR
jgi:hypothetical protein